jgi:hypothetical protein
MTRADSVLSTPPTNTSAIQVQSSRRTFLAQAAGVAAGGAALGARLPLPAPAAPAAAATALDPLFELIAIHRKTHIAHMAALNLQARLERENDGRADWVSEKPCHDEDDAFMTLYATPATTLQGLLAKLAYLQDLASEDETEWMINDRVPAAVLIQSFAASLENIRVQS